MWVYEKKSEYTPCTLYINHKIHDIGSFNAVIIADIVNSII